MYDTITLVEQQRKCMQHRPVVVSGCVVVITAGTTTAKKRIYIEIRYSAAGWVVGGVTFGN